MGAGKYNKWDVVDFVMLVCLILLSAIVIASLVQAVKAL